MYAFRVTANIQSSLNAILKLQTWILYLAVYYNNNNNNNNNGKYWTLFGPKLSWPPSMENSFSWKADSTLMFELTVYGAKTFIHIFTRAFCRTLGSAEAQSTSPYAQYVSSKACDRSMGSYGFCSHRTETLSIRKAFLLLTQCTYLECLPAPVR